MHNQHLQHTGESPFTDQSHCLDQVNQALAILSTTPLSLQQPEGAFAADGFKSGNPGDGIQLLHALSRSTTNAAFTSGTNIGVRL